MKENRNNLSVGDYYLGLDIGTNSVGWAVTDTEYNIPRFKGQAMWGVRLFEEAQGAEARRMSRTARRRLSRRKQRLKLLELLFSNAINEIDPGFFNRLDESMLHFDDKSSGLRYTLFNDADFSDKQYFKLYPTVYHLRSELIDNKAPHDVRLVYLALHHIMKSRGHFLFELSEADNDQSTRALLSELNSYIFESFSNDFCEELKLDDFTKVMCSGEYGVNDKKKRLTALIASNPETDDSISCKAVAAMLAGSTVSLKELFNEDALKDCDPPKLTLKGDIEESFGKLESVLSDIQIELLTKLKTCFDSARLALIKGDYKYICDAKVALFKQNNKELHQLKDYVKNAYPEKYRYIFSDKKDKLNNYAAYSGYKHESGDYSCKQEDFCAFLKKELPSMANIPEMEKIWKKINDKEFLPKLKGSDNGLIPYQLHKAELEAILENASAYLPFLNTVDPDGHSVKEKIIKTFEFRIPYYVGPLNEKSPNAWIVRTGEKIYPWNFEEVVDLEESAKEFLINLVGRCTYTGEPSLPLDSLTYSRYMVLNEINPLKLNGENISVETKQRIYRDLFENSAKSVTKKGILNYLRQEGLAKAGDELSGVDDKIKSRLKAYHDLKFLLDRGVSEENVEEIIKQILVFSSDKKMLRRWLDKKYPEFTKDDADRICRLKYKDWGRLSARLLTGIYTSPEDTGEVKNIMDCLWDSNDNLMQILSNKKYGFNAKAAEFRTCENSIKEQLAEMYVAPAVRRSVWQALKICDEIVDIKKSAPKKIFIEVARDNKDKVKAQRTESRKDKLIALYKACGEEANELFDALCAEDDGKLRQDKLYLYYTQLGKCMYSGEQISLNELLTSTYDIDHIFPQSRIKDNSIDNRVLVKSVLNRDKSNTYPIDDVTRERRYNFWTTLKNKGLISQKKYERLIRNKPLTVEELSAFVARQLTETQQSTKAVTTIMNTLYPKTRIVYSKAGNVSDFRQDFNLVKCREINDLHHAKDAYLNIVVGNVYDTRFTEQFFKNIRKENYSLNRVFEYDTKGAWDKELSIATVKRFYNKNNALVTRRPHEVKGQLYDVQLMSAGKGQLEKKTGLPIEKYGGYNKVSGAYFCVVEHTAKKKRIRSIEPVFIYKKALYEDDPVRYCVEVLGLVEPVIVHPQLLIHGILELDGYRVSVCGRTGEQIILSHTYPLILNQEQTKYIKALIKYHERCTSTKKNLPISSFDTISLEKNIKLYSLFESKLSLPQYGIVPSILKYVSEGQKTFTQLSMLTQCKVLIEILHSLQCNRVISDLTELCGKSTVGVIRTNKVISNRTSAVLINQSVTGLFETRVDLLK